MSREKKKVPPVNWSDAERRAWAKDWSWADPPPGVEVVAELRPAGTIDIWRIICNHCPANPAVLIYPRSRMISMGDSPNPEKLGAAIMQAIEHSLRCEDR